MRPQYGRVQRIQQIQRPPPSVVWPLLLHLQVIKYSSHPHHLSFPGFCYSALASFGLLAPLNLLAPLLNSQYGLTHFPLLPETPGPT
jgi:hypothetical protein